MYNRDKLFIDGQWSAPESGTAIDVISPHTEEAIGQVCMAGAADVDRAVAPRARPSTTGRGRGCSRPSASTR